MIRYIHVQARRVGQSDAIGHERHSKWETVIASPLKYDITRDNRSGRMQLCSTKLEN